VGGQDTLQEAKKELPSCRMTLLLEILRTAAAKVTSMMTTTTAMSKDNNDEDDMTYDNEDHGNINDRIHERRSAAAVAPSSFSSASDVLAQMQAVVGDLKKESMAACKLWQAQHARLGALDELEMAKMTLRLREPNEEVPEVLIL
jgi:hypothetical protein